MDPYYQRAGITIFHGDCRDVLPTLPPARVDLVVTSPPYFAQREYGIDPGEIGRESDPRLYLDHLTDVTRLLFQTTTPAGHLFINLGDKYNADGPVKSVQTPAGYPRARRQPRWPGMSLKSLMLLPQRYAIRCLDDLGIAIRAEIVWQKGVGGADGKATDRVRRAHEHLFHLTRRLKHGEGLPVYGIPGPSVWTLQPSADDRGHDADFPLQLPLRVIQTWCPLNGLVLDPFVGSGTSLVAAALAGRRAIGIDIEERFCDIAARRLDRIPVPLPMAAD